MRITWHPDAEREVLESAAFYNQRVPGLGADFLDEIDVAVEKIVRDPDRFPVVEHDVRRCRATRFPYSIYFRRVPDGIRILVVIHHNRRPDYWKGRG
jgi:toxin ParE1/3/4